MLPDAHLLCMWTLALLFSTCPTVCTCSSPTLHPHPNPQVRFDKHLLLSGAEAAATLLSALAAPRFAAGGAPSQLFLLQWAVALIAAPAAAAWLAERHARCDFLEQQRTKRPGLPAPRVSHCSFGQREIQSQRVNANPSRATP